MKKVWGLLDSAERRRAVLLLVLMAIGMTLETASTVLVFPAIMLMMQQDLASSFPQIRALLDLLGRPTQAELIAMVMLGLVVVYLVKNLFLAYLAWRQTRFAYGIQAQLSQRLFAIYLRQPYTFHLQRNSAQLIRNVTSEVSMFTEALISGLNIGTELLVLLGISCLLLAVEPVGALVAVMVLAGAGWLFYRVTRASVTRWGQTRQRHDGLRIQHLQQGLGGAKDVKLLGRESDFIEQYGFHNAQSARVGQRQAALQMLPRLWLELLAVIGLATLVLSMLAQGRPMTAMVPTLGLFAAAAFRLMPSANRILSAVQALRYTLPVVSTLDRELHLPVATIRVRTKVTGSVPEFQADIVLNNVTFSYPSASTPAIRDISIRIRKGESVGFVGPSGSGKSTLIDVVLGLLSPAAGVVEVDGNDIRRDMRAWQDQVGYVPQSIYLTDDTLRRNVAFGLPESEIDDDAVKRAIRAAQLDDFAAGLPAGMQTVVGERGIRLSGGQRQRIGIARALYHNPAVLVLDEATSALDTATERGVMQAVTALRGSKTILIVAHRLSTVAQCDRLYRLDQGRVAGESVPGEEPAAAGVAR